MMKKTLAAVAVLGAFAGAACAADVQLYGRIDYGFDYKNIDYGMAGVEDASTFGLNSGINTANRVGLKASEDLGNGLTVGFVLENGFKADDGTLKQNKPASGTVLFDRESQLYVQGAFGKVGFGRMGALGSGAGSYCLLGGAASPFSTGWNDIGNHNVVLGNIGEARLNNAIVYVSPEMAGFKVHAQYSFGEGMEGYVENESSSNRYMGLGVTYDLEALHVVALYDMLNEKSVTGTTITEPEDTWRATLGASYDFGVAKAYFLGQYFDNANKVFGDWNKDLVNKPALGSTVDQLSGYGLVLGVTAPLGGGNLYGMVGYMDAEKDDTGAQSGEDLTRWQLAVGYDYKLSKSTTLYAAAGMYKDSNGIGSDKVWNDSTKKYDLVDRQELTTTEIVAGMVYAF